MSFIIRGLLLSFFAGCSICYIIPNFSDSFTDTSDYSNLFTDTSNSVVVNSPIDTSNAVFASLPTDVDQPHSSEFAATDISTNTAQNPNLNTGIMDLTSNDNRLALANSVIDENLFLNPSGDQLSAPTSPSQLIAGGDGGIDLLGMGAQGLAILAASIAYFAAQLANSDQSMRMGHEGDASSGARLNTDSKRKRLCPEVPYGWHTVPTCDTGRVVYVAELPGYLLDGYHICMFFSYLHPTCKLEPESSSLTDHFLHVSRSDKGSCPESKYPQVTYWCCDEEGMRRRKAPARWVSSQAPFWFCVAPGSLLQLIHKVRGRTIVYLFLFRKLLLFPNLLEGLALRGTRANP